MTPFYIAIPARKPDEPKWLRHDIRADKDAEFEEWPASFRYVAAKSPSWFSRLAALFAKASATGGTDGR